MATSKKDLVGGQCEPSGTTGRVAIIGRTNFGHFSEMVRLVCDVEIHQRPKIAISSGTDPLGLGWRKLEYMSAKMVSNRQSWAEVVSRARDSNDKELLGKIRIVEK